MSENEQDKQDETLSEPGDLDYGGAIHAAIEAVSSCSVSSGWVSAADEDVARAVVNGLRSRGFLVIRKPYCQCGWNGTGNHQHYSRI